MKRLFGRWMSWGIDIVSYPQPFGLPKKGYEVTGDKIDQLVN